MLAPLLELLAGAALASLTLWDAFETILVPRRIGRRVRFTRYFYRFTWRLWRALARGVARPSRRETLLGVYAPLSLILLLACWASGLVLAFAVMQRAALGLAGLPPDAMGRLLYLSGETFFTLGFGDITPGTNLGKALAVAEAGMGFAFLGTVIGYLPTLYATFSEREIAISMLDARAGSPPTAGEFIARSRAGGDAVKDAALRDWERWSAQLLETHISYPLLAYYRSQHVNQSWLATLTMILDACALVLVGSDPTLKPQARLTFAMARHALVDLMQQFVSRRPPPSRDRLPAAELTRLVEHLGLPGSTHAYEQHLADLRQLYEPYAQALADHLLYELPSWVPAVHHTDNWRRAPWDLPHAHAAEVDDDHF
jgi:hypothetical protein